LKRLPEAFETLIWLRRINLIPSVVALALLAMILRYRVPGVKSGAPVFAALTLAVIQPVVIQALSEFRSDHIALAVLLLAIFIGFDLEAAHFLRRWMLASFLFTFSIGFDGKLFLVPIFATLAVAVERKRYSKRDIVVFAGATATGMSLAIVFLALIFTMTGVSPLRFWTHVLRPMAVISQSYGIHGNLQRTIWEHATHQYGILAILFFAGLWGWVAGVRKSSAVIFSPATALLGFALLQPFLVSFPFKQYVYSIYLLWAGPLVLFFSCGIPRRWAVAVAAALLVPSLAFEGGRWRQIKARPVIDQQIRFGNMMLQLCPSDSFVAAQPPQHPVFRRDATYSWMETAAPDGPTAEDVLRRFPDQEGHFTYQGYLRELNRHPPALAVINSETSMKGYRQAVTDFVTRIAPGQYRLLYASRISIYVRNDSATGVPAGDGGRREPKS
jgi:hypothetical protein